MAKKYSDCFYCGGVVEEQLMPREVRWQDRLFVFENVPMGTCRQCGEKVLKPGVAKTIDRIIQNRAQPTKTIQVPVYSL
ncbi:YgiT-type zinc finger protein [bacterium]|nr:YgiT-type zinc finger protein [bacterium]